MIGIRKGEKGTVSVSFSLKGEVFQLWREHFARDCPKPKKP